jgi:hypothetical protein
MRPAPGSLPTPGCWGPNGAPDEYVLTFTHPVFTHPEGPVAGIVGMDVTVQSSVRRAEAPHH